MAMETQPFHLGPRIGDGAHSEVFLATLSPTEHRTLSQDFPFIKEEIAVKVLNKASLAKTETEAILMRDLAHPNVCELYGIYYHQGKYCLAMEHHEQDLFSFAFPPEKTEALPESLALYVFTQVLLGVDNMHAKGFIHGDLKLENVLMSGTRACLTDFGKSQAYDTEKRVYPVGTLPYTAPETLLESAVNGPEIDVWSLGVILYALIEGYFPFYGNTKRRMRSSMAHPLRFATASMGAQVLITSMLSRRPQMRPSANEVLNSPLIAPIAEELIAEHTPLVAVEEVPVTNTGVEQKRCSGEQIMQELQQILFYNDISLKATTPEGFGISPPPTPCTHQDAQLVH